MKINYLYHFIFLVCLLTCTSVSLHAINIDQSSVSVLEESEVHITEKDLNLTDIVAQKLFSPYGQKYINIGSDANKMIWIKVHFENHSKRDIEKILLFGSPFLEHIFFYDERNFSTPRIVGQAHDNTTHKTLKYYFKISVPAEGEKTYYIKIYSEFSPVRFMINLEDELDYIDRDRYEQLVDISLLGFITALMIYSFIIGFYLKEGSYFSYAVYLMCLIYFQVTYVGLTQVYASYEMVMLDRNFAVPAVYFLLISTSLFAISFLKIKRYPILYKIYIIFIVLSVIAMFSFHNALDGGMTLSIMFAIFLILYNFFTAVYVYLKGYTQARLYVLGFGIVLVSYLMIIADSLAWTSMMQEYPNLLLWTTAIEALILSLAFADGYTILQKEKESINKQYLEEASQREFMVTKEVVKKTAALNLALEGKELLLQEVHHRVKNNLQIILSIIELKNDELNDSSQKALLVDIENRINAIAKTYETLIVNDDLQHIDMKIYIEALLGEMESSFEEMAYHISLHVKSNATLPLKEAVYIGLIINELVTNAYKYAFSEKKGNILVSFMEEKEARYVLRIEDDGKGFTRDPNADSLGLKLMETLVLEQLKGSIAMDGKEGTKYLIAFRL